MPTLRLNLLGAAIMFTLSSVAFASGSHGSGHHDDAKPSTSKKTMESGHDMSKGHHAVGIGQPGKAKEVTRTLAVVMNDNYYEPENLVVNEGETIRFSLSNNGKQVHEFNIGTAAMHKGHQKEMMMMVQHGIIQGGKLNRDMMKMDMGNGQTMEHNDPNSILLAPGESGEIIWAFNQKADLEFACNVPGHYEAGMSGKVEFN